MNILGAQVSGVVGQVTGIQSYKKYALQVSKAQVRQYMLNMV
jgi:hypothetical protein